MINFRYNIEPVAHHQAYTYQLHAVETVCDMEYAALFHEQGLGKTKIALDLILYWINKEKIDSVVIVTKKGLLANWKKEIIQHTNLSFVQLEESRRNSTYYNRPIRLYLTHYEGIKSDHRRFSIFLKTRKVGVVLDEAHRIKNPDSALTQCFLDLAPLFTKRIIMTGTPVANRPYDIWSQIRFLDNGKALGDNFKIFKKDYDLPCEEEDKITSRFENHLADLFKKIRSFTVRENKKTAGIFLPEKTIRNIPVEMEKQQTQIYKKYRDKLSVEILRDGKIVLDNSEHLLKRLTRLIQVASNPSLIDESYAEQPGKILVLKNLCENIIAKKEKVIVWTNFIMNADYIAKIFSDFGTARIHGKMNMQERNQSVERFLHNTDCRILVATPGAAKEGLTLTVANTAIFYDRSFSLNDYLQAQDRIHRISQENPCEIINLLSTHTIDERIDRLLWIKKHFAEITQGDKSPEKITYNQAIIEVIEEEFL